MAIRRRMFLATVAGGLLGMSLDAEAQQARNVYRIGYLSASSRTSNPRVLEAFRQGLRELGWIEGQNIIIEYRWAEGRFDRLSGLAAELVQLKVDVIVAAPTPAALAAKNASGTIPIVGMSLTDPVGVGLIASLARPGANVTGVSYSVGADIFQKHLQLLTEVAPRARRVAVLSNPASPARPRTVRNLKDAARPLGLQLRLLDARGPGDFDAAFAGMSQERVEALLVVTDPAFLPHRARLVDLAMRNRLPSVFTQREDAEAGGLMSYGPRLADLHRRGATYVDKILKGAKPADLPVEEPTNYELVINIKTAKAIGLTIPESMLQRADQVIE
jgi:putative ABC transport system substrate-binding protein